MGADQKDGNASGHSPFAIELIDVCKSFGEVQANRNISLRVSKGSIHGIVGENGAGKSTLMNILYGLYAADSGSIHIDGEAVTIRSSADAIALGIGMVHQHFMLVPNFTVLENIILGSEGGVLLKDGKDKAALMLKELANAYGMEVNRDALIEDLPVGIRQRVEIIKAIKGGARILILDEPTGVLTPQEAESLFAILDELKKRGVSILLITHKLSEIMAITDNVSIIRDGRIVGHRKTSGTTTRELAEMMVGRPVLLSVERGEAKPAEVRLAVKKLGCTSTIGVTQLEDVSFEVRSGEILGVAGVAGNGQTELLELLSGMRTPDTGGIEVLGHTITTRIPITPDDMREFGVGHIPEDRHHHGLVLDFEAQENIILGFHHSPHTGDRLFIDRQSVRSHAETLIAEFDVRPKNPALPARKFSGGNQQKLVIAREIDANPNFLLVGQPTRGVDIGAIEFIHKQLIELRDNGCAILLVSVELDEIVGLSDRIMVLNDGRIVGILDRDEADERTLGLMMAGIPGEKVA